jgi:ArsR family transcriptional regulator
MKLWVYDYWAIYAKNDIYYCLNMNKLEKNAEIFQILSNPVRLQILKELRKREACVCHLQAVTKRPQAYVSQQLRVLRDANIVRDEKQGQFVYYYLENKLVIQLLVDTFGPADLPKPLSNCNCPFCEKKFD